MVNEFGEVLDKNGYRDSLIQRRPQCFRCGIEGDLVRHEPWNGLQNREKSKALGMWVMLCPSCHEYIHHEATQEYAKTLRKIAEAHARAEYGWTKEEFIRRFGKSYSTI